ncbi:hypothetical protein INT44_003578 [Umbelopsis vinacea]|uniref:Uncharacterized protein n=1 Tax=Umbelopsis vinacea TaxID=44442 RepID=A0A8H7PW51_9FUNG|nr:hypothetical protein INT44_003578 [Umbelopsis vinacea]
MLTTTQPCCQLGTSSCCSHSSYSLWIITNLRSYVLHDLPIFSFVSSSSAGKQKLCKEPQSQMWHISFLLMYTVMLLRVLVICDFKYNRAITVVALCFLLIRFADWPFELAYRSIVNKVSSQTATDGQTCWASWYVVTFPHAVFSNGDWERNPAFSNATTYYNRGTGVVILNFIGDVLANLFLSGLFLMRLYQHYKTQKGMTTSQNPLVGIVVRKSLLCFILTFIVNLIMNILKISLFLGMQSDALTVFFEIIESTLLVEALRFEPEKMGHHAYCQNCGMIVDSRQYRHRQTNHYLNEPPAHPDMLPDFPLDLINGTQDKRRSSIPSFLEEGSITGLSTPHLSEGSSTPTLPSQWNKNADTKPQ